MRVHSSRPSIVRILRTPATEAAGVADRTGWVCGETQPSSSRVEVIGDPVDDFAWAVRVDDLQTTYWFAPDLLEQVELPRRDAGPNARRERTDTPVTRALSWLERFLPKWG